MKKWFATFGVIVMLVSTIQVAQAGCMTVDGYLFAASEKLLEQVIKYSIQKDIDAVMNLVNADLVVMVHGGVKVYIEGESGVGKLKVRFPGVTIPVWTVREAVQCN
jgi:hypothetical protein